MTETVFGPPPSPEHGTVTDSWEDRRRRQEIAALTATNKQLTKENVELLEDVFELERRLDRAEAIANTRCYDPFIRRILRALDGDPHEFPGRRIDEGVEDHVGGGGVDPDPVLGGGAAAVGEEAAGSGDAAEVHAGGEVGVSGSVGAVAAWPYDGSGDA